MVGLCKSCGRIFSYTNFYWYQLWQRCRRDSTNRICVASHSRSIKRNKWRKFWIFYKILITRKTKLGSSKHFISPKIFSNLYCLLMDKNANFNSKRKPTDKFGSSAWYYVERVRRRRSFSLKNGAEVMRVNAEQIEF